MLKRATLAAAAIAAIGIGSYIVRAEDKPAPAAAPAATADSAKPDSEGFVEMFNGKDLTGWHGLEGFWSVKDGAITGSEEKDKSEQTFLVYTAIPTTANFEMHYKYRFVTPDGNSGVQFRSKMMIPKTSRVGGYQADCDAHNQYTGIIYDEAGGAGGRGIMSNRGEKTTWDAQNKRHNEPLTESNEQLKKEISPNKEWNDCVLKVEGNHIVYSTNGHVTTELIDESPKAVKEGLIALQLHKGFTMEVQFKDMKIKILK